MLVYDNPLQHPRISDSEKKYIIDAIGDKVHQRTNTKVSWELNVLDNVTYIARIPK